MLVPAIVVAVALLAAAFLMKGGDSGGGSPAAAPTAEEVKPPSVQDGDPSDVVSLDAITLNLADGRFLKLGVALQLAPEAEVTDPISFGARALDETIDLMGGYTYKELSAPGARTKAKDKLSEAVSEAYDGDVLGVYFTEFVMQ
jgi:flagellar FliL protein